MAAAALPRYKMGYLIISISEGEEDAALTVRRNGDIFYLTVSPSKLVNSPATAQKYKSDFEILRSSAYRRL